MLFLNNIKSRQLSYLALTFQSRVAACLEKLEYLGAKQSDGDL